MQSKLRWAIGAVIVAAIGVGAAFFLLGDNSPTPETAERTAKAPAAVASDPGAEEPDAEPAPPVAEEEKTEPEEALAAASAPEKRERTGRGRVHGKALIPADGPRGLEVTVALHRVPAYEATDFTYDDTLVSTAVAGQEGKFEFKSLPFGSYVLLATATGYTINGSATLTVERPEREVTLSLVPGAAISGRVINQAGGVVPGARVFVGGWDIQGQKRMAPRDRSLASQTLTNDKGEFATINLRTSLNNEPGYKLAVKADGYGTFLSDYIKAGTQGVEFMLKPGGIVAGMLVKLSDNTPLAGKKLVLTSEIAIEKITGETDAEGFFFLTDVPAGRHSASLRDEELVLTPQTATIQVTDGVPSDEVVLQAAEGGRISGRVYDRESNDGIAQVELFAYATGNEENSVRRQVKTGADGAYMFKGLIPGAYRIEYRKPEGYPEPRYEDPDRERLVSADVAKESGGVDFALSRGLTISGRVVDESGKPLADANVNGNAQQANAYDYVQSKADGTFVLAGYSPRQQVHLSAAKQGYSTITEKLPQQGILKIEEESLSGIEIVLGAESTVSGTLVDSVGRPKSGIQVYAISTGRNRSGRVASATSAADGSVKLDQMAAGEYGFIFPEGGSWSTDQVTKAQKIKVAKGEHLTGVKIVYTSPNEGGLTISGRVLDTKGNGIPRAEIQVHSGNWRQITADATGNYTVGGLSPGQHTLSATSYQHSGMEQQQAEAGAKNVNFTLKGMATISGRVVSASSNQPVQAFRVRASGRQGQNYYVRDEFKSVSDAEGRFKLADVEDGSTKIEVRADGFADATVSIPTVTEFENREDIIVRVDDGVVLAGRVLDKSGKGLSGAMIFIGNAPERWQMDRQRRAVSGGDGSFKLTSLPAGQSEISVAHANFTTKSVSVNLVPRVENKVDVVLSSGGTIEGRVTENGKTPVAGQYVYANVNNDHRNTQTDADGRYTLGGLPDGNINIGVHIQTNTGSNRSQNATVDVKDGFVSEVNFDFRAGTSTVEGTIYAEPGVPLRGEAHVSGQLTTATGTTESYGAQTTDGNYRFEGVAEGTLTLRVFGQVNSSKRTTVQVAKNTRVQQDILLYGGNTVRVSVSGAKTGDHVAVMLVDGPVNLTEVSAQSVQQLYERMVGQGSVLNNEATMSGIAAGQYTVVAFAVDPASATSSDPYSSAKWATAQITVQDGKEATARIGF